MPQHISEVEKALNQFEPISLKEMDSVQLMNRTDTKYVLNISELPDILKAVRENYFALEVKGIKMSRYETLYFDTEDHLLFRLHATERSRRSKVRYRKYVESEDIFFEIKMKDNKGRTDKRRIKRADIKNFINEKSASLISSLVSNYDPKDLRPQIWNSFQRMTLVSRKKDERVTIDVNISFRNDTSEKAVPDLVIVELKQSRYNVNSPIVREMRRHKISSSSISKYIFGTILLNKKIKSNIFKPKLLIINKMLNGTLYQSA